MAQAFYRPPFKKQLTGSTLGPYNCNMAAAAMLADRDTLGLVSPTPDAMRKASGDTTGGTNQTGAHIALTKYGIEVDIYDGYDGFTFANVVDAIKSGRGLSVSGDYDQVPYALSGSKGFYGDHQVFVNEVLPDGSFLVFDPIADGRAANVPKSPVVWSADLLRRYLSDRTSTGLTGPGMWVIAMRRRRVTPRVDVANIRSGPGTNYGVIGTLRRGAYLARGSKAQVGGSVGGNTVWHRVWVPSAAKVGYMHSSVVSLL